MTLNENEKAKRFIDMAYDIAAESNTKVMLVDASLLLCQYYLEEHKLKEFQETIDNIKELKKEVKIKSLAGNVSLLLGRYYLITRDFNKADLHLRQALRIFEGSGDKFSAGQVYYYLSKVESMRGREPLYRELVNKSLEIFDTIGSKDWKVKTEQLVKENKNK